VLGVAEGPRRISLSNRFCLETARRCCAATSHVRVVELPGTIELTDPEPIVEWGVQVPLGAGRPRR
jgi:hypothetical protein